MSDEDLRALAKVDLHRHLEGAIRLCTVFELSREAGVPLPADTVEPERAVERTKRDRERRIELVQMPAQPLLAATPLRHQVVTVVNQQLQLPQRLLAGSRTVQ